MVRVDGQWNQARPPVQPTANPNNNKTHSHNGAHGKQAIVRTANPNNKVQHLVQPMASPNKKAQYSYNGAYINQIIVPTPIPDNYENLNPWSSQLFDCMNDSENAVITLIAPCVTFGQIAEILDEGATPCATAALLYAAITYFGFGTCFVYSYMFRAKIRKRYGLPEVPGPDWTTHLVCMQCALCQEYRELKHRGFDPKIGWVGNVQAQEQEMMTPPKGQRMMG